MSKLTLDDLEAELDKIVAEALRRERQKLNVPRACRDETAGTTAQVKRALRSWRDHASTDALRAAGGGA